MNLENIWYLDEPIDKPQESGCGHDYIVADGSYVCQDCGQVDIHRIVFAENNPKNFRRHVYKRRTYFRDKLRLFTRHKQSTSDDYVKMLELLKNYQFETVHDLKRILKKLKYGVHHKYLYSIYYDVKQHQLIDIKPCEIERLENQFYDFERLFKQIYPKHKYILNYSIIIRYLLQRNGYQCYKNILLPRNHHKSMRKFIELLN